MLRPRLEHCEALPVAVARRHDGGTYLVRTRGPACPPACPRSLDRALWQGARAVRRRSEIKLQAARTALVPRALRKHGWRGWRRQWLWSWLAVSMELLLHRQ